MALSGIPCLGSYYAGRPSHRSPARQTNISNDEPHATFPMNMHQMLMKGLSKQQVWGYLGSPSSLGCFVLLFQELTASVFTFLVVKGTQESHLRIRQLVELSPRPSATQDYVARVTQLCVLPDAIVHIFTHLPESRQPTALKFLEVNANPTSWLSWLIDA